ncbi:MAG TPA: hypothetical protein VFZ38_14705 [Vicinamibacterales bacterium]
MVYRIATSSNLTRLLFISPVRCRPSAWPAAAEAGLKKRLAVDEVHACADLRECSDAGLAQSRAGNIDHAVLVHEHLSWRQTIRALRPR